MPIPSIPFNAIAPFLSILVGEKKEAVEPLSVHNAVQLILLQKEELDQESFSLVEEMSIGNAGYVYKTSYVIEKPPSWAPEAGVFDKENHCYITFNVGNFFAFYFSEKGRKDEIRDFFAIAGELNAIHPVSISHLYHNFVNEDEVKMLWLSDISGKSSFKVGSKVLGGDSVADTLDPILDQYYMMSAVRTKLTSNDETPSIGINPFKSSIWRGPCKTWHDFENRIVELLDVLENRRDENLEPISILAYPIFNLDDLLNAYDFTVLEYEALPSNSPLSVQTLLQKFEDGYHFEQIESPLPTSRITLDLYHQGMKCATYALNPRLEKHYVKFDVTTTYEDRRKGHAERIEQLFNKPELIKCWFESGHAMVGGMVFKTEYRDVQFNKFIWADYEDYDLFKEKPVNERGYFDISQIGRQKSLFCWVKNFWSSRWQSNDDFNTTEYNRGWLYCDDGAGEKADFIHFDGEYNSPLLTFIHIKAAKRSRGSDGSNRRLSVGVHDIVVNQAIKNIRYYDRKKLCEALGQRIEGSEQKACWNNGNESSAQLFLDNLRQFTDRGTVKTRVVIIQPHTKQIQYNNADANNNVKRQLDTLLVSTNNAISATNTEFFVIGAIG